MNLVLTMAGRYLRFINEGYKIPKYLLPWGHRTILAEILHQFTKDGCFKNVYLVANKRDEIYVPHVKQIVKQFGIDASHIILLGDTAGQAETAFLGLKELEKKGFDLSGSVVFHNIDTLLYNRNFKEISRNLDEYDGYIDVFRSSNHAYSYVLFEEGIVKAIVEKQVISDMATSGMYGFSSTKTYYDSYSPELLYISQVYQKMIDSGYKITISKLSSESNTIVLGTPSEYLTSAYLLNMED